MREFQIAVFPGDGIGRDVITPCLALLESVVAEIGGFQLSLTSYQAVESHAIQPGSTATPS